MVADECGRRELWGIIQLIDFDSVTTGYEVVRDVHGHLDGVVSHLFLDVGEGSVLLNKERGEGMPEVMLTNMSQSGFLENRKEDSMSDIVPIKHTSRL